MSDLILQKLPTLPIEIINKILYQYKGLVHPNVTAMKKDLWDEEIRQVEGSILQCDSMEEGAEKEYFLYKFTNLWDILINTTFIYNGKNDVIIENTHIKAGYEFSNTCYHPNTGDIENMCSCCIKGVGFENEFGQCVCWKKEVKYGKDDLNEYFKSKKILSIRDFKSYKDYSKKELQEYLEENNIKFYKSWNKSRLTKAIMSF